MNIKEFWQEKKEEKKQLKKQTKEQKKKNRSPEQKLTRTLCIIFTFLVVFGVVFTTCENFNKTPKNNSQNESFSQEVVELLSTPVDTNLLLKDGRYVENDWKLCVDKFKSFNEEISLELMQGVNLDYYLENSVSLNSNELRGLVYNLFGTDSSFVVKDFRFYQQDGIFFEKSIVYLPLDDEDNIDVNGIYLTTISEIDVIDKEITAFNSSVVINNLNEQDNNLVVEALNEYYDRYNRFGNTSIATLDLNIMINNIINSSINSFALDILKVATLDIVEDGIVFVAE